MLKSDHAYEMSDFPMRKKIYIVRHCSAQGQQAKAKLTEEGLNQAEKLVDFFNEIKINRIISSPYLRAIQSIKPLSKQQEIDIEIEDRLAERVLCGEDLPDWQSKLELSFSDLDVKLVGGESSREAMSRIVNVVEAIFQSEFESTIIVTHGNLMSLLLHHVDQNFGFREWRHLSNPDVYLIVEATPTFKRLWKN
jgi:2,3-bisphosphoglycerate-dependent phosphoglycerate mutase